MTAYLLLTSDSDLARSVSSFTPVQLSSVIQFQAALENLLIAIAPAGSTLVLDDDGKYMYGADQPVNLSPTAVRKAFSALTPYGSGPCPTLPDEKVIWQELAGPFA